MFDKISNSWQLVKASWAVLRADKELLLFPVISSVVMIVIMLVFMLPLGALLGLFAVASDAATDTNASSQIVGFVLTFLFYIVAYIVSIYFNVALVGAALIRLDGGDPTVGDGLRIAAQHWGQIVTYALISATVGVVLQWLRDQGFIGRLVASFTEFAWNVATFLVVPILIVKEVSPWEAIRESTALLKRTWGEQLTANFGIGTVFTLLFLLVIFGGGTLVAGLAAALNSAVVGVVGILIIIALCLALGTLSGALGGIYRAMLYRYAESGIVPTDVDIALIRGAFIEKPKRKGL